jgi:hypothetical protein
VLVGSDHAPSCSSAAAKLSEESQSDLDLALVVSALGVSDVTVLLPCV